MSLWDGPLLCHSSTPDNVGIPKRHCHSTGSRNHNHHGGHFWLLDYTATHPDAKPHYYARDVILHVSSDASYLYEECARSQSGGHFFITNQLVDNGNKPPTLPTKNGTIITLC